MYVRHFILSHNYPLYCTVILSLLVIYIWYGFYHRDHLITLIRHLNKSPGCDLTHKQNTTGSTVSARRCVSVCKARLCVPSQLLRTVAGLIDGQVQPTAASACL